MITLQAQKIGALVNLNAPGYQVRGIYQHGSIAAAEDRSIFYLSSKDVAGPYNIFVPGLLDINHRISESHHVEVKNGSLIIEAADVLITTRCASGWPGVPLPGQVRPSQNLNKVISSIIIRTLENKLTASQPYLSLADLWGYAVEPSDPQVISNTLWYLTRSLYTALQQQDFDAALTISTKCLGMGEGLTPAGDDVIVGICAVFSFVDRISGQPNDKRINYCSQMVRHAEKLTNMVSAAFLRAACEGELNDPLRQIVSHLLNGEYVGDVLLDHLSQTGHTSGYDGLAGVLLGLTATIDVENTMDKKYMQGIITEKGNDNARI